MKRYGYIPLIAGLAILAWSAPGSALAEDLVLQGPLQSTTYTAADTIRTQGACEVLAGTIVKFESTAMELKPGFRVKTGGTFMANNLDPDGLPNDCELQYFGNYDQGPSDDPDGDQLTNLQECALGTDPTINNPDNDGDGLPDWWEVQYAGADLGLIAGPNGDANGNGISNWIEYKLGTDPTANDLPGPGIYYEYDALGRIEKIQRLPSR